MEIPHEYCSDSQIAILDMKHLEGHTLMAKLRRVGACAGDGEARRREESFGCCFHIGKIVGSEQ